MRTIFPLLFVLAAVFTSFAADESPSTAALGKNLAGPADRVSASSSLTYPLDLVKFGINLPRIADDPKFYRILNDQRTIFYKLDQVWQHWIPANRVESKNLTFGTTSLKIEPAVWGIFDTAYLADTNANKDFPWETTLGLNLPHKAKSDLYGTVNMLSLPEDENGRLVPILVLAEERPVRWIFPPGTTLGEIIYVNHDGKKWVQEIRMRTKSEDNTKWFPHIFRPVKSRDEFQHLTNVRFEPTKRYMTLRNPEEDEVFELHGTVERLPDISENLTKALLSRPFQNVTTENWSPAPDQDFAILPKDYCLGLLSKADSQICGGCHRQSQISVRHLIPRDPTVIKNPGKVGNIRGCDGIFSWHPFDYRSVRKDDKQPQGQLIFTRAFDARNNVVRLQQRGQAPANYKMTLYVQQALKGYELPSRSYLHDKDPALLPPDSEDGLSPLDRVPAIGWGRVVPSQGPDSVGPPAPEPVATGASLRWVYHREYDPAKFYRGELLQDGKRIGVWDPVLKAYRKFLANGQLEAVASTPPLQPPKEVLDQK